MAWSTPLTAVSNAALTAAQWNASVRDNLLETAVAKAANAGSYFAASGVNSVAQRTAASALVSGVETETSTSYTNLATVGPTVTVTLSAMVWVSLYCSSFTSTGQAACMSFELSGANSVAADDIRSIAVRDTATIRCSSVFLFSGLAAGSTTATAKYRVTGGTGSWDDRRITAMPF